MTGRRPFTDLTAKLPAERKGRMSCRASELRAAMGLAELRLSRALSQEEIARRLGVSQPAVGKLEKRADMYVSNLRRFIEAIGGTLEITAKFNGASVTITGLAGTGEADAGEPGS